MEIKRSTIPNAGLGLFYSGRKTILPGQFVAFFSGRLLKTPRPLYEDDYAFLDCEPFIGSDGSFANDPLCDNCVNAKIDSKSKVIHGDVITYSIIAYTYIYKGDEIFISYGKDYWSLPRRQSIMAFEYNSNCFFDYTCMIDRN